MKKTEIKTREELFRLDQRIRKLDKGKEPAGTTDGALSEHNSSGKSHPDMRTQLFPREELTLREYKNRVNGIGEPIDENVFYIILEDDLAAIVAEAEK